MKKKRPPRKSPDIAQLENLIRNAGLEQDPLFKSLIQEAKITQDGTLLEYMIQDQMPIIQERMMQVQSEVQRAQMDPFHPRPTHEMFSDAIPVAYIPDVLCLMPPPPPIFRLDIGDFMQHTFICGSSGSGKTRGIISIIQTLKSIYDDDITIWIFEPKKGFRRFLYPDFKVFTFMDTRENLFRPPTPKIPDFNWRSIVSDHLGREQQYRIGSKNQLIETLRKIEKITGNRYPSNEMILDRLKKDLKKAKSFRESDPIQSLINRFNGLVEYDNHSRKVVIPIKEMMKIDMVIELGDATIENDKFRMAMLLSRLYHYKKHNRPTDIRHYNLIVIDEGRELFSGTNSGFGESILEMMFALSREMDIGFIVSTQEPKNVSTTIKSNVRSTIAFPLSEGKERSDISMSLSLNPPQQQYYQRLSAFGHGNAIVKYAGLPDAFPIMFPDVADPIHKVTQSEVDAYNIKFLTKYRMPDPIMSPVPPEAPLPLISDEEKHLMHTTHENPLLPVTRIYLECNINPKDANEIKSGLIRKGYLTQESVKVKKKGKANVFMRLTPEAHKQLGVKSNAWNKPGIKHQVYCHLVKKMLESEGWDCELEGQTENHTHRMDVLASKGNGADIIRHDYEITVSLKNVQDNINQALKHKLVSKVIIVAEDKDIEKCRKITATEQQKYGENLEFRPISDYYMD